MDIKENLARNLSALRKSSGLTQLELAEKLNYSDKAVSKWERGEAVPDLYILKKLADLYGVTIDNLISEPKPEKIVSHKKIPKLRLILSLSAMFIVWLVVLLLYFFSTTLFPSKGNNWLLFIYALPITNIILVIMAAYWGRSKFMIFPTSFLNWTMHLAVYISLETLLVSPPETLPMMFLIAVPIQVLLVLYFLYKKIK